MTDSVKRIHLCYKTQRGTVNILWQTFYFQSEHALMKSPDQTCQFEPRISDSEAVGPHEASRASLPFTSSSALI